MRIGLLIYGELDQLSGGYLYDRKLYETLIKKGHTVRIFSQKRRNYIGCLLENFSSQIIRELDEFKPDILLEDELNHPSCFILNPRIKKIFSFSVLSIVHHLRRDEKHPLFLKSFYSLIENSFLRPLDGFIFNSFTTQKRVESITGSKKLSVTANPGKDQFRINNSSILKDTDIPLKIIYIGNIIPRKNLLMVVSALSRFSLKQWRLTVIGSQEADPAYYRKIKKFIRRKKLGANINFKGKLDDSAMAVQLQSHQILTLVSDYEGFGIVLIEAMGAGLAVIAGSKGGSVEIVKDNKNGFLAGSRADLAGVFEKILHEQGLLLRLRKGALKTYPLFPTWDESMEKITAFLEKNFGSFNPGPDKT